MKPVLVTGGCGFLGAWVVRALVARGRAVRILDARPDPTNLDFVEPGLAAKVDIRSGDVTNRDEMTVASAGCGSAVHLAGIMTVDCRRDPPRAAAINLIGSLNLFEAALAAGMDKVAYVSTAGVYGPDDGEHPLPMTHYGALKLAVEGCARATHLDRGLPSVGFRPYIIYGPGESTGISAGPSIACRAAARGEAAEIKFTGRVGLVHVSDVAQAFAAAIDADLTGHEVHNLVGEVGGIDEFITELRRQMPGARVTASGSPLSIAPELAVGAKPAWLASLPTTGLAAGIAQTLAHHKQGASTPISGG